MLKQVHKKTARRPLSYAGASDMEPCEGRKTSPSNPTKGSKKIKAGERDAVIVFRCTKFEKLALINKARDSGLSFADLLRGTLKLIEQQRRKPIPRVDPELIRAVSRIGSNVNQIARGLNSANAGNSNGVNLSLALTLN